MILNFKDRLVLLKILPQTGSLQEMQEVFEIVKLIKITQEEKNKFNYKEFNNSITWDTSIESDKEYKFNLDQQILIKTSIDKLDKEKKINFLELETFLKFLNN